MLTFSKKYFLVLKAEISSASDALLDWKNSAELWF